MPPLSESLAGRAVFFELWPFSQEELRDEPDGFLDAAFRDPGSFRDGPSSTLRLLRLLAARTANEIVLSRIGADPLPFGDRLTALPISYLWQAE
ncbi:hypothetical protein GCM10010156_44920 [Planobispora rosea]|uniref:Uncharacterized protein n=1 Tax=Planobispora rosea TaxID=35762 RepID=A0A8J3S4W3_PLARO|nr:hypothetical protein [Planobispora rosea]GGS81143.1 hypothetical protein GCM10010156_44920 [Planobispora rosea]GIH85917.1 hypothetical protein Pro02_43250 [Planobispora rosea]